MPPPNMNISNSMTYDAGAGVIAKVVDGVLIGISVRPIATGAELADAIVALNQLRAQLQADKVSM